MLKHPVKGAFLMNVKTRLSSQTASPKMWKNIKKKSNKKSVSIQLTIMMFFIASFLSTSSNVSPKLKNSLPSLGYSSKSLMS